MGKTILLDTNHLIHLSRDTPCYSDLKTALRQGSLEPVICRSTICEWGGSNKDKGLELAGMLDQIGCLWIGIPEESCLWFELMTECVRARAGTVPHLDDVKVKCRLGEPMWDVTFLFALLGRDAVVCGPLRFQSCRDLFLCEHEANKTIPVSDRRNLHQRMLSFVREGMPPRYVADDGCLLDTAEKNFVRTGVLERLRWDMTPKELVGRIDVQSCPGYRLAIFTFISYAKGREKSPAAAPGDAIDLSQIHLIPYVDYALIDRPTLHHVIAADRRCAGRVFATAPKLLEVLRSESLS